MSTPDVPATGWFKSKFSQAEDIDCVEVNLAHNSVYVRHSQYRSDAVICCSHTEWNFFTRGVKTSEFNTGVPEQQIAD